MQKKKSQKMISTEQLVIWQHPIITTQYFLMSLRFYTDLGLKRLAKNKKIVAGVVLCVGTTVILAQMHGPHQTYMLTLWKVALWWAYWISLGIISSAGLGMGLHTFLLYLAPHIASVTLAAYECNSLDFPSPPYPDEIICPKTAAGGVSYRKIVSKVQLESMMWGLGTAIGELTSYFLARAHRLCGEDAMSQETEDENSKFVRAKKFLLMIIQKSQFMTILVLASVPNPLFDLAGMACGNFLVPFWSFFLPTLIGKAVIKTHLQILFVIAVFNEGFLESCLTWIAAYIPLGKTLQQPIREQIERKRLQFKNRTVEKTMFGTMIDVVVTMIIVIFVAAIVNAMAQRHHKRSQAKKPMRR